MTRRKKKRVKAFFKKIVFFAIFLFSMIIMKFVVNLLKTEREVSVSYPKKESEEIFSNEHFAKEGEITPVEIVLPFKNYCDDKENENDLPEFSQIRPEIPAKYRKPVTISDLSYSDNRNFLHINGISIKNATQYSDGEIKKMLEIPMKMKYENTKKPQVLIYHTHATESFNPFDQKYYDCRYNWRSRDNNNNMVAVGAVVCDTLNKCDIATFHDTLQHDYPSYNGSYGNSFKSVSKYLKSDPQIKVALDLHRDAIERDTGEIIKPTVIIDGKKYAQIMIISNCDDGSGLIPNWRENFRFACQIQKALENISPGITRPILLSHRRYNQQLSTGSLLIEFGSHASTLEEAKRSAYVLGRALTVVLMEHKED